MPSLDFIYDIVEKLDEEDLDYIVVSIRKGSKENKVDVFFNIEPETEDTFNTTIVEVQKIIKQRKGKYVSKKKPKRKRRKKE